MTCFKFLPQFCLSCSQQAQKDFQLKHLHPERHIACATPKPPLLSFMMDNKDPVSIALIPQP